MNPATLINLAALACAAAILWRAEPALARMGSATHWMIRYAMLLIAGGALGTIINILCGGRTDAISLATLAGLALLLSCDRRLRFLLRQPNGDRHAHQ